MEEGSKGGRKEGIKEGREEKRKDSQDHFQFMAHYRESHLFTESFIHSEIRKFF
jgi:hypothetical protein